MAFVTAWVMRPDGSVETAVQIEEGDTLDLPEGYTLTFTEPPPPPPRPPEEARPWAIKAALEEAGLLETVEAAAEAAGLVAKWRFRAATVWLRQDVLQLAAAAGLDEAAVDALFVRAQSFVDGV